MASPMVLLELLFTTLVIYAYEGREVVTFDYPGAYFHADMLKDKNILLKVRGRFVYIMFQINPAHKKEAR